MTQLAMKPWSTEKLLIVIAVIAVAAGATIGVSVGYAVRYEAPTTRTFYLFDRSLPFNEAVFNIPHDTWMPDTLTVNKGDHVLIHFLDTEGTPEGHTYTMDLPYTFNAVVYKNETQGGGIAGAFSNVGSVTMGQSQTATITFTASWAGTFRYYCAIHQPTMTGYLVVLG
jgi:plastocyanin